MRQMKFLLIFFVAISFFSYSSERNNPNIFKMYITGDPILFDPRVVGTSETQILIGSLFEGLMRLDRDGNPEAGVALRYEMAEDYLSCIFYLRKTSWSNGDPVTAHDFANAWREALSPHFNTNHAIAFYPLKNGKAAREGKVSLDQVGVRALDDERLYVEFEYPAPFFIELTTNPLYSPVYLSPSEEFVSNGPFKLDEYKKQDYIVCKKNEKYWDAETVQIDEILTMVIPDTTTALMMYESGQLDIFGNPISEIPVEAALDMEKKGMLQKAPSSHLSWLIFNTESPPFNSRKIRQAFSYAINREKIVTDLLQRGDFPSTSILPKKLLLQDEPYFIDGNIEEARSLFEEGLMELGMTKETMPKMEIKFSNRWNQKTVAQAIQDQWKAAFGIVVELCQIEKSLYSYSLCPKKEFQLTLSGWDSWISDPSYNLGHIKTKNPLNLSQWENPDYRELIDLAEKETNLELRMNFFHLAEILAMDEMPIAPIFSWVHKYSVKDDVAGLCFARDGRLCLRWVSKNNQR